jgi:CspA family cold shock protein
MIVESSVNTLGNNTVYEIEGILKWYSARKGYGFIVPKNAAEDVMIHKALLDTQGFTHLNPGAVVRCLVEKSAKGLLAIELISVFDHALKMSEEILSSLVAVEEDLIPAVVKWYQPHKGYGFAISNETDGDIMLSRQTLRACGINNLVPGQRILITLEDTERGKTASLVRTA